MDPFKSYMRLDKYTSRICRPAVSRFCLRSKIYRPIFNGISYKVYKLFPLQHMFGDIDILNKKLKNKDVNVLKQFVLYKESKCNFTKDWPKYFHLIEVGDFNNVILDKKNALQECIDIHVDFLKKRVYSLEHDKIDIKMVTCRIELLLYLHIIMAREFSEK